MTSYRNLSANEVIPPSNGAMIITLSLLVLISSAINWSLSFGLICSIVSAVTTISKAESLKGKYTPLPLIKLDVFSFMLLI